MLYRTEDLPALHRLGRVLEAERNRAAGLPVLEPQLRLVLPDDPDSPWRVRLELYDVDRPERWCTAADVVDRTAAALDVAQAEAPLARAADA